MVGLLINHTTPVIWVELGEVPVHDPPRVETVLVGVEGNYPAKLDVYIPGLPLEPHPFRVGVIFLPVEKVVERLREIKPVSGGRVGKE